MLTKSWRQHERHFFNGFGNVDLVGKGIHKVKTEPPEAIEIAWNGGFYLRKTKSGVIVEEIKK